MQTAYGSVRNAVDAMRNGAYDYITKPFKNEELLIVIEKALENKNIREELSVLREEIAWKYGFDNLVGTSASMKQLKGLSARVAASDIAILITGESGTGKELLAKAIHFHSRRRKHKFIPIDCTSIPANLMESEFFGKRGLRPETTVYLGDTKDDEPIADMLPAGNFIVPFFATDGFRENMSRKYKAFVPENQGDLVFYLEGK